MADTVSERGAPGAEGQAEASDRSLLCRYRRGSQDAATQLYLRYAARLRGLARSQLSSDLAGRLDFDDVVQSVFGSFFRRVNRGLYDVPVSEELWRLFLVLALHKVRDQAAFHRAARRDVGRTLELTPEQVAATTGDSGESAALAFLNLAVEEALALLPAPQREMVELRAQGHDIAEIAARTGRSKRTTERLLQEARARLQGLLQEG